MSKHNLTTVIVPSASMLTECKKLQEMSESQVADDYLKLPSLPYNQELRIDKMGVVNFDALTKQPHGILRYGALRMKKPDLFPECKDPELDYEDEEQVSPVVVISGDQKYRTDQMLWFPLSDIIHDITARQGRDGKKLLPIKVFLDEKNQWLVPLMNLSKGH